MHNVVIAADPKKVAEVVKIMRSDSAKGIVERKWYPDGGVRIVFVNDNIRYTFFATSDANSHKWLSVWIRRGGSDRLVTFTDFDLDGTVGWGSEGHGGRSYDRWQKLYDQAITNALLKLK